MSKTNRTRATVIELPVRTNDRVAILDITGQINNAIADSEVASGVCHIFVPHTTAGILINEHDDPAVVEDIASTLDRLVPHGADYAHLEGNADAHIKSAMIGVSQTVLIKDGRLALGRWQGIFFCEFDGPRHRQIQLKIVPDPSE